MNDALCPHCSTLRRQRDDARIDRAALAGLLRGILARARHDRRYETDIPFWEAELERVAGRSMDQLDRNQPGSDAYGRLF